VNYDLNSRKQLMLAENPSVSLREPPSLRREGAFFTVNFKALGLVYQDILSEAGLFVSLPRLPIVDF
jgi:hypothetical protein